MVEVRNNGVPLIEQAPKAKITQSMMGLADALVGVQRPQHVEAGSKSSFSKLLSKWANRGGSGAGAESSASGK